MENLSYKLLLQRQSTQKKVYGLLCVILLVAIGAYSYFQWQKYTNVKDGLAADAATLEELNKTLADEKNAYFASKDSFDVLNKMVDASASQILPKGDQYTDLTRQIDAIEDELLEFGDFEIANIDYGAPAFDEELGYGVLPVRMNIKSSADNFLKFLQMMETSGSFTNKLRLMSISSIRLNFASGGEMPNSKMITFSLQLNAYFQK